MPLVQVRQECYGGAMAWWPRLRESFLLRAALEEAEDRGPSGRERARRTLNRGRQRRSAAESLWANGHSAEGLRLIRDAFADVLEAAAALARTNPSPPHATTNTETQTDAAAEAPETPDAQNATAAATADTPSPAAQNATPAVTPTQADACWAELGARGLPEERLTELRELAALPPPPDLDDEVSAADARSFHRLSEATTLVIRTIAHATRTPQELRRVRRRRWAGVAIAVTIFAALAALKVAHAVQEANAPWIGRYYPGLDFQGDPEVRGDPKLAFDWAAGAPMSGIPTDRFTVRWDTCLVLDANDTVSFAVRSDDGHRVYVDDELVLDHWSPQPARWATERRPLSAGAHHLRVEYFEQGGNARMALRIEGASGDLQSKLRRPTGPEGGCP